MSDQYYQRYTQSLRPILQAIEPDTLKALFEGTGIRVRDLHNGERMISRSQELAFYRNLLEYPGSSGLAMSIGLATTLSSTGAVGYAQMACRTARQAIELGQRYRCLTIPYMRWDVLVIGKEVVHRITDTDDLGDLRPFVMEIMLAMIKRQTEELMGADCQPTGLSLCYQNPGCAEHYIENFGVKPRFAQRTTELRFPAAGLDCERHCDDPLMMETMEQLCQQMASRLMREPDLVQEVLIVLRADTGTLPCVKEIAQRFGVSPRTLRRRLAEKDSSYRMLGDQVRRERAVNYLRDNELALTTVAERCGFAELHSFYSAFKRWTGFSPASYRSQLAACHL